MSTMFWRYLAADAEKERHFALVEGTLTSHSTGLSFRSPDLSGSDNRVARAASSPAKGACYEGTASANAESLHQDNPILVSIS